MTAVWIESWQVIESHLDIAVGDRVEWNLTPANDAWIARLFAGRRVIGLTLDAYAYESPSVDYVGKVSALRAVFCERRREKGGDMVPLAGSAVEERVITTGDFLGDVQPVSLCGFIADVDFG